MQKEKKTAQELADMIQAEINAGGTFIKVHPDQGGRAGGLVRRSASALWNSRWLARMRRCRENALSSPACNASRTFSRTVRRRKRLVIWKVRAGRRDIEQFFWRGLRAVGARLAVEIGLLLTPKAGRFPGPPLSVELFRHLRSPGWPDNPQAKAKLNHFCSNGISRHGSSVA